MGLFGLFNTKKKRARRRYIKKPSTIKDISDAIIMENMRKNPEWGLSVAFSQAGAPCITSNLPPHNGHLEIPINPVFFVFLADLYLSKRT